MMSFFTQALFPQLLLGENVDGDVGYVVAVLPQSPAARTYTIADVLTNAALGASIVFLREPVGSTAAEQEAFVNVILGVAAGQRILYWSVSPTASPVTTYVTLAPGPSATIVTNSSLNFAICPTLLVTLPARQTVTASANAVTLSGASSLSFYGSSAPSVQIDKAALTLPFCGEGRGCLQFGLFVAQRSLANRLNCGFLYGAPPPSGSPQGTPFVTLYAPLIAVYDPQQYCGFAASLDPIDSFNAGAPGRSALTFTGQNLDGSVTVLESTYTTPDAGISFTLTPVAAPLQAGEVAARLVFAFPPVVTPLPRYLTTPPAGDFIIGVDPTAGVETLSTLLAGLQATEYFGIGLAVEGKYGGDRLRFVPNSPAWAPTFPLPVSSPIGVPFDPAAALLDTSWQTSWATLRPPQGTPASVTSFAQPPGFNLFGIDALINPAYSTLYGGTGPAALLSAEAQSAFPLVPYAAVNPGTTATSMTAQQVADYEAQILGPQRHAELTADVEHSVLSVHAPRRQRAHTASQAEATHTGTTPSGYLITYTEDSKGAVTWDRILLGRLLDSKQDFAFEQPGPTLTQAFQSGQLFLVIANASSTGTFENTFTIEDWTMAANPGRGSFFGDYANVVIVKAVPGPLYDPDAATPAANLIANPSKWTNASAFAPATSAPGSKSPPPQTGDPTQLVNLSLWMQNYFAAAFASADTYYFQDFLRIAQDPNWTGVLVLRGDITGIPAGIAGITAGVSNPSAFNVHHLAIPLTPVTRGSRGPEVVQSSSVSGLIYYVDPALDPNDPESSVAVDSTKTYDFRLLSLKVLFENSTVASFSSYAQVALREFFGSALNEGAAVPPPPNDAVVLTGSYHLTGNRPVYSLTSVADSPYPLANNVLQRVDIAGVTMATVQADPAGTTIAQFALAGFLDFAVVPGITPQTAGQTVDLFGFGNAPGQTLPNAGIAFGNLLLTLTFPTAAPSQVSYALSSAAIRLDTQTSTVRSGSLVQELNLQLTGLVESTSTPQQIGYLPVVAMVLPAATLGASWYGLALRLDLGTPGQLAADAGLTATLLLAWSPASTGSNYGVQVGLQLPGTAQGAPLISLQNVLKLSIGQIALYYTQDAEQKHWAFLLLLNEIALSFLGLLKIPPNGATAFYLFGSPNSTALGWYAVYDNEPRNGAKPLAIAVP